MPIRLNKLIKQYRVGLDTLVDYLHSIGLDVQRHPNAKIDDKYRIPLQEHFGSINVSASHHNSQIDYVSQIKIIQKNHFILLEYFKNNLSLKDFNSIYEEQSSALSELTSFIRKHQDKLHDAEKDIQLLKVELSELQKEYTDSFLSRKKGWKLIGNKITSIVGLKELYENSQKSLEADKILLRTTVPWDCVIFKDGEILINVDDGRKMSVRMPESKSIFNIFIQTISKKLSPIEIVIHSKISPEIVKTPDFNEVFCFLSLKEKYELERFAISHEVIQFIKTAHQNFQEAFLPKDKSKYLYYLVEKQADDYRYVPFYEKSIDSQDAILFTIKGKGLFLIWENINPNTATYIFPVSENQYETVAQSIIDYAASTGTKKRLRIHYGISNHLMGVPCRIVNHIDFNTWRDGIERVITKKK